TALACARRPGQASGRTGRSARGLFLARLPRHRRLRRLPRDHASAPAARKLRFVFCLLRADTRRLFASRIFGRRHGTVTSARPVSRAAFGESSTALHVRLSRLGRRFRHEPHLAGCERDEGRLCFPEIAEAAGCVLPPSFLPPTTAIVAPSAVRWTSTRGFDIPAATAPRTARVTWC